MSCHIRLMSKSDIPQVTNIDREAFPTMWPPVNFNHELSNRLAHYIVATDGHKIVAEPEPQTTIKLVPVRSFWGLKLPFISRPKPEVRAPAHIEPIVGFVGMWIMVDEAHIINIAVRASHRGKGIGELLLISSIELAERCSARVVTLEVRITNTVAQNLYAKYGFKQAGVRKGYYTDNKEDAVIMTTDVITSPTYIQQFQQLKSEHFKKLGQIDYQLPV